MYFNDLNWWLIILFNFIGYFLFILGVKSENRSPLLVIIEFMGGIITFASFVAMFWVFGIKSGLILIPIFWLIITPIVGILVKNKSMKEKK